MKNNEYQLIEYPSMGMTYCNQEYGVYEYGEYGEESVLSGQVRRTFLDSFETLEEAKKAYPKAEIAVGSGYVELNLNHLPDEEGK